MSKYYINQTYYCSRCNAQYNTELQAIDCFDSHFTVDRLISVGYEKGSKIPNRIQIEVSRFSVKPEKDTLILVNENKL